MIPDPPTSHDSLTEVIAGLEAKLESLRNHVVGLRGNRDGWKQRALAAEQALQNQLAEENEGMPGMTVTQAESRLAASVSGDPRILLVGIRNAAEVIRKDRDRWKQAALALERAIRPMLDEWFATGHTTTAEIAQRWDAVREAADAVRGCRSETPKGGE